MGTQGVSRSQMQDELKRRSTLSRLEGVAEAVWMWVRRLQGKEDR